METPQQPNTGRSILSKDSKVSRTSRTSNAKKIVKMFKPLLSSRESGSGKQKISENAQFYSPSFNHMSFGKLDEALSSHRSTKNSTNQFRITPRSRLMPGEPKASKENLSFISEEALRQEEMCSEEAVANDAYFNSDVAARLNQ
uniref:Uncharacterized protein n=1 Tax=Strombidium inclinatum TaxID=197538 RepID=A0A7S3IJ97_9SPIT|mmetsp:Transcript_19562/g.30081  ORF Transcript_19562/g.30081 Transcript_19562/m.30081 type:complete len:144 (+) Transcript_19562:1636-2067(+)|eukprot:CAMPEP_0170484876 /NCGR_PEP_ID=MMETSP0208-20121228/4246_1 /TAXON_ID=197538 /ORGANISM="Strombidium inclinatum, Strain S3" /LENGTH=143 /DNA_ID=CAMNT_0010758331 /DNA_START=1557 /DNA_END=1988 /DNA_ORIENTATION=+